MLHAGLDLSRRKLDVCLLSESGEQLDQLAVPPDADALRTLAGRIDEAYREPVCAVIESMTGARLVHDTLEQEGWDVEIADAQKVKGLGRRRMDACSVAGTSVKPQGLAYRRMLKTRGRKRCCVPCRSSGAAQMTGAPAADEDRDHR